MSNVRFCLDRGIPQLQSGQTAYASKLRFGSRLDKTWVYFKHRSRAINAIFAPWGPTSLRQDGPDLAALAKKKAATEIASGCFSNQPPSPSGTAACLTCWVEARTR